MNATAPPLFPPDLIPWQEVPDGRAGVPTLIARRAFLAARDALTQSPEQLFPERLLFDLCDFEPPSEWPKAEAAKARAKAAAWREQMAGLVDDSDFERSAARLAGALVYGLLSCDLRAAASPSTVNHDLAAVAHHARALSAAIGRLTAPARSDPYVSTAPDMAQMILQDALRTRDKDGFTVGFVGWRADPDASATFRRLLARIAATVETRAANVERVAPLPSAEVSPLVRGSAQALARAIQAAGQRVTVTPASDAAWPSFFVAALSGAIGHLAAVAIAAPALDPVAAERLAFPDDPEARIKALKINLPDHRTIKRALAQ